MDEAALKNLKDYKQTETVGYTRHLLDIAQQTHAEILAFCNRTVEYPFDLERNANSFVFLAGAVYNNLLNILEVVRKEDKGTRDKWKNQIVANRSIKVLVDRRDALSHGLLHRWLVKDDSGQAKLEDDKYPHLPVITIRPDSTPIFFQWNDKHRVEFNDCMAWQEEVLQELYHQQYHFDEIIQKIKSGEELNDIVRRTWYFAKWGE